MSLAKKKVHKRITRWLIEAIILCVITLFVTQYLYPNHSMVADQLNLKTSVIVDSGGHNGFPDLIYWQGYSYVAFRAAKTHVDRKSSIKILRSADAEKWSPVAEMGLDAEDIRDPKFAVIHEQLFLYALKNKDITIMPYTTIFSSSKDGLHWRAWQDVSPQNWVFWRPKTNDDKIWYVAADDRKAKRSALFSSTDGMHWDKVSTIYSKEFNAEIELTLLGHGKMLSTIRVEGMRGDPRTLIGSSTLPYASWTMVASHVTRLDGASSFVYHDKIFSAGRYELKPIFKTGNLLNQKRTSLFLVTPSKLVWLSDLPSSGDTGYASAIVMEDKAYIAYYTSDPTIDYPWIIGQFQPTQIWLAQIDLGGLEALANDLQFKALALGIAP